MNKVTTLDRTLIELGKQTHNGESVALEDLKNKLKIEKPTLLRALDYLTSLNYCEKKNDAYQITFEGEYFIDKTIFIFKRRPFLFKRFYTKLKVIALISNTLLVLSLGVLNYLNNINKRTAENQNTPMNKSKLEKANSPIQKKLDTLKKNE
jgi:hypothetical protein